MFACKAHGFYLYGPSGLAQILLILIRDYNHHQSGGIHLFLSTPQNAWKVKYQEKGAAIGRHAASRGLGRLWPRIDEE